MYLLKRFMATMLDSFLIFIMTNLLFNNSNNLDANNIQMLDLLDLLVKIFITCFYYVYMESKFQRTFGKRIMGLRIIQTNNLNLKYLQSFNRYLLVNLFLTISIIPVLILTKIAILSFIAFFLCLFCLFQNHNNSQFIWDKIVKTKVISEKEIYKKEENQENYTMDI